MQEPNRVEHLSYNFFPQVLIDFSRAGKEPIANEAIKLALQ